MDDVFAVADKIAVLRLGRNNGVFDTKSSTRKEIIEAITGSVDNAVTKRASAHGN
jgi:D-xylose transport system ATP-binding protein